LVMLNNGDNNAKSKARELAIQYCGY
jgi:hypothetical protein